MKMKKLPQKLSWMTIPCMIDIVQKSLISYENFRGGKIIPRILLSMKNVIFISLCLKISCFPARK